MLGLFQNNLGLVYSCISYYFGNDVLKDKEIVRRGMVGLWKAIRSYDSNRSSFSTWGWIWIRKEVQKELREREKERRMNVVVVSLEEIREKEGDFWYNFDFEERILWKELRRILREFLDKYLTEIEKEVVVRRLMYEDSFDKICKDLELSKRKAYKIFEKGISKLRKNKTELILKLGFDRGI